MPDVNPVLSKSLEKERGYTTERLSWGLFTGDDREDNIDLRWPNSVAVYDRMRRQDSKVKATMRAVKSPLLSVAWRIDQGAASAEVTEFIARELGLPIKGVNESDQATAKARTRDRFSWLEHLRMALLMLEFGHMAFEQVYRLNEDMTRAHLRKLAPRMPWSISQWNVARDGGLESIEQYAYGTNLAGGTTIGIDRLVVYVHEREGGDWWGQSLLRPAYKNWLLKDRNLRVDSLSNDRNGMGIPVHTEGEPGQDTTGAQRQAEVDRGLDLAAGARSGDNSGMSLRHGAKFELVGVTGQLPSPLNSVKYHDGQIAEAVLANFLNLGQSTSSYALGRTLQEFFTSSLDYVGNQIADVSTQHIVEDLVDHNFGLDVPAPRIVFDDLAGQDQALAYAIKALVDAGVIQPDGALETYLRTAYRLPQQDNNAAPNGDDS